MGLISNNGGIMDVIRCDEPSYLVWKWHPVGADNRKRENSIRLGSSIRVKDGEVAVFAYKASTEKGYDILVGPYDGFIKTANLPILTSLVSLAYNGDSPFQAEIYYINLAEIVQVRFGIPYFDVYDFKYSSFAIPTAVRGTLTFKISDYQAFIKLHRLIEFDLNSFKYQIKDALTKYVKGIVTNIPIDYQIPVLQLERKILDVDNVLNEKIKPRLYSDFGVTVSSIDLEAIDFDKDSDGYRNIINITQNMTMATLTAENQANIQNIYDMQKVNVENQREILRIQREESQYAMHKETQTSNIGAYQTEAQMTVGVAGAESLGKMGENNAMNVSNGGGVNPVSLMTGMAMGGAIGQNVANTMNGYMNGLNIQQVQNQQGNMNPPPLPGTAMYNVAINGTTTGPYDVNTIMQMITAGQIIGSTLIWTAGMMNWSPISSVAEFSGIFKKM